MFHDAAFDPTMACEPDPDRWASELLDGRPEVELVFDRLVITRDDGRRHELEPG